MIMDKYEEVFNSNLCLQEKIDLSIELAMHDVDKVINRNIKEALEGNVFSEFLRISPERGEHVYYYGNLKNHKKDDWRFCEVNGKREALVFKRLVLTQTKHFNLRKNHINDYKAYLKQ